MRDVSPLRSLVPRCSALLGVALLSAAAEGRVWHVGGANPDFTDIQPAIVAATAGDIILVRPGTYSSFTLDKGVTIAASSTPFDVTPQSPGNVVIENIPAGERASVSGLAIAFTPIFTVYTLVEVKNCAGDVTLSGLELTVSSGFLATTDCLTIVDCATVAISSSRIERGDDGSLLGAVHVERSSLRIAESLVTCGQQQAQVGLDGAEGAPAIEATDSLVVVASCELRGGRGATGGIVFHTGGVGGEGGDALRASGCEMFGLGAADPVSGLARFHWIGGDGGDAGYVPFGGYSKPGGDGGEGFSGASALTSRVALVGGTGGAGSSPGAPGTPFEGSLAENPALPLLELSGNFAPGTSFTIDLDVVLPGNALLVVADDEGFLPLRNNFGPPLSAIPGGQFVVMALGHFDLGHRQLFYDLPSDPALGGFTLHFQAAFLLDASGLLLSNASSRILGE